MPFYFDNFHLSYLSTCWDHYLLEHFPLQSPNSTILFNQVWSCSLILFNHSKLNSKQNNKNKQTNKAKSTIKTKTNNKISTILFNNSKLNSKQTNKENKVDHQNQNQKSTILFIHSKLNSKQNNNSKNNKQTNHPV